MEFQTAVEEIFDVQVLRAIRFPEVVGFQQETIQHTFIVPPSPTDIGPEAEMSVRSAASTAEAD